MITPLPVIFIILTDYYREAREQATKITIFSFLREIASLQTKTWLLKVYLSTILKSVSLVRLTPMKARALLAIL
jgi:hypothetical protein